jgi:anti-sigma-K factor RskA
VSSGLEHHECAEALGAYALGALSETEAARVRRHLSECRECRAELDWLRAGVDVLPTSVPPIEPPPELKQRLMEVVEREAELLRAAGPAADQPQASKRRRRGWWPTRAGARAAVGVAALCVVVVVVVLVLVGGGSGTRVISAQVAPSLAGAQASLQVRGTSAALVVRGMPAPAADHVNEIWVKRGSAQPIPAGTFVIRDGSVDVERAVRSGDLVMVTVEPGRGTAAPTTTPVIVAKV